MEHIPEKLEKALEKPYSDNEKMKEIKIEAEENVLKLHFEKLNEFRDLLGNIEKDLRKEFPERGVNSTTERDFLSEFDRKMYQQLKSDQQRLKIDIENTKQEIKKIEAEMERRKELINTNREN